MVKYKRFLPILVLAVCMLFLVVFAAWTQSGDLLGQVRFYDSVRGQSLDLFYDEDQDCYVLFLPPYVALSDIGCATPRDIQVTYEGDAQNLSGIPLSQAIRMTIISPLRRQSCNLRLEQNAQIPSLFIEAEEGILEYLHADKKNTRDVVVNMLDSQGNPMLHRTASMYGRGNGSWESPSKRPYNLEFSTGVTVGPFSDVTKLCLLAEFSDESKLRNSLAYYAGQELDIPYASPYLYTDVYVNGEYIGLYGIVTKQEYQKHLKEDKIQAVFEIASSENRVEFFSSQGWRINVMYGSRSQVEALVNGFEDALLRQDWVACERYIHVESFARKYAMEEFLANLDLAYASQYFFLNAEGKIQCMLPWDYDWTLGSSHSYYNNRQANELKVFRNEGCWYGRLLEQEPFRQATVKILQEEFNDEFLRKLEAHLAEDIRTIRPSWQNDKLRWQYSPAYNQFDIASGVTELEGFQPLFAAYFRQRRQVLTGYYTAPETYGRVRFFGTRTGNLIIPLGEDLRDYTRGATMLDVNVPGERFLGWVTETGKSIDKLTTVGTDMQLVSLYEEVEDGQSWLVSMWKEIAIVLAFGGMALAVFLAASKRTRTKTTL